MDPQQLKQKQDYLYQQILAQNYDPEEFQQYMEDKNGLDLEAYSLIELKQIVQRFKKGERSHPEEEGQVPIQKLQVKTESESEKARERCNVNEGEAELEQPSNINEMDMSMNSSNKVFYQFIKKQFFSNIYKRIHQKREKIYVKTRSYLKKEEGSMFGGTYIVYSVQTPKCQWKVYRRFKDFQWLHSKLSELLPGYPIPPIPKKTKMRSFEDKHLEQRMTTIEQFLNKLLSIPEICSEEIVEEFLSVVNEGEFQKCRQKLQMKLSGRGSKMVTLKGEETIDKTIFKVDPKEFDFFKKTRNILYNLKYVIHQLQNLLKKASEKSFQLSSCFNQFHQHLSQRQSWRGVDIVDLSSQFASQLGQAVCLFRYKLEKEYKYIHNYMDIHWNYEEKYTDNIISSMLKTNKDQIQMLKKFKNMSNQTEPDSSQQYTSNNKVFIQYQQAREHYRLKLSFLSQEIKRHSQYDLFKYSIQWTDGLQHYMEGVKDLMLSGADQLTKSICINEGKHLMEVEYIGSKGNSKGRKIQKR